MNEMIYNPMEEFDKKFKDLHLENTKKHFDMLTEQSHIDIEANRKTVKEHKRLSENLKKIKRRYNLLRVLRILMYITLLLIPIVIWKVTPRIRALKAEIERADQRIEELYELALSQMAPLNALFTDRDSLRIIEQTMPLVSFAPCFTAQQEANMVTNYDFEAESEENGSTVDLLAGEYNGNPFLFENRLCHTMGTELYHGYKTIRWSERYRGSDGKMHTRTRTQSLHATVQKPKPFFTSQVRLQYCAQGGPELSFTRDATNLDEKNERQIERYVKKGEKRLKKKTDKAIGKNQSFTSMSNTDFEVLFDALDRTHEVQFRTLFTPLAQTNMVDLIRSQTAYGDDFHFIKKKRTNTIITEHSQGRAITVPASAYVSYSYDYTKECFIGRNTEFFKQVYFDFAPLLAIPLYQERPVHSLQPIPDCPHAYSHRECEALSYAVSTEYTVHPSTKTQAILRSVPVRSEGGVDEICIKSFSYDIVPRVDYVSVHGDDGRWHSVPVPWDDYIPLTSSHSFFVASEALAAEHFIMAKRGGLCIFN